ncbi:MAG: A/G-specific adenine glycosylase [Phycisphaerales bacterium]|nr:A/G-specific adenine glycosylase [Phycisphaerales bacterium]
MPLTPNQNSNTPEGGRSSGSDPASRNCNRGDCATLSSEGVGALVVKQVEQWFKVCARPFPWRTNRTPWRSLVSEYMLQQTQAARVAERFERVMASFPTPSHMASADPEALHAHWQGLGYYSRARNLHAAATRIAEQFDGKVPLDVDTLRTLPGVGPCTAGSIASIVGGHRAAMVDGNIRRVLCRLSGDGAPVGDAALESRTWDRAQQWVDHAGDPALANEGVMELGATVCLPRKPACGDCPVSRSCIAFQEDRVHACPKPKQQVKRKTEQLVALLVQRGPSVLLAPPPEQGRFLGTWRPPLIEVQVGASGSAMAKAAADSMEGIEDVRQVGAIEHVLTHRSLQVHVFCASATSGARLAGRSGKGAGRIWADPENPGVPLSSLARRILALHVQ